MKRKVLFIGHSAGYTGAPLLLLRFISWFKDHSDIPFDILLRDGGDLVPEYAKLGNVLNWHIRKRGRRSGTALSRILKYPRSISTSLGNGLKLKKVLVPENYGLIYSNTATNGEVLAGLRHLKCPVVSHIHEMDYWIVHKTGLDHFNLVKKHSDAYIAVSRAVMVNLIENHGIPEEKIHLVHGFVPQAFVGAENQEETRQSICRKVGIETDSFIIGGCGSNSWRKGLDIFIHLANVVIRQLPEVPIHFVWLGVERNKRNLYELQYDIHQLRLENRIHLLGIHPNPNDFFLSFDIFALTSREDPFPLVMLEAASAGKPIVCFEQSGGAPEFVGDDCGFVVPYLDIHGMAQRVIELAESRELRQLLGGNAARKAVEEYSISSTAPKILKVIERYYAP